MNHRQLKGRTLPSSFFERVRERKENTGTESHMSGGMAGSFAGSVGSSMYMLSDQVAWDVVAFIDARSYTSYGLPVVLLPIPKVGCLLTHCLDQLKPCSALLIVCSTKTQESLSKQVLPNNVRLLVSEEEASPEVLASHFHQVLGSDYWGPKTFTVWWYANQLFLSQLLWRPYAELHHNVQIQQKQQQKPLVRAWKMGSFNVKRHIYTTSQQVWDLSQPNEYYDCLCKMSIGPGGISGN